MASHSYMLYIIIFLLAAVIAVPLARKSNLGSVIGYLIAGVAVGPWGLKLITQVEDIMHFAEFGVVLFLFLIGLELDPKKLWSLRIPIFGMGGVQVAACTILFFAFGLALSFSWKVSLLAAMGLALSSTAIALQILKEKNALQTTAGSNAFSILLFQDIAVIPMLAILPLLTVSTVEAGSNQGLLSVLKVIGILVTVVVLGRLALRPIFRLIASIHLREIFTALSLLLVLSMAYLMSFLDISMGLGAFIAGVLLADSEYRHALETDIEPFKGLLLGLFFISVGMSIDFGIILDRPVVVALLVVGIVGIKMLAHWGIAIVFKIPKQQRFMFSAVLSQVGEFAFVLYGAALVSQIISKEQAGVLMAAVAISMLSSPLLMLFYEKVVLAKSKNKKSQDPDKIDERNNVIIAGFGRFGQIVGRLLYANKLKATVLDYEPDQIELTRRFGFKVYYGDATRLDLLESAGIEYAKILVVAIDNVESNLQLVDLVTQHFPQVKIFARARNVQHYYQLLDRKVHVIERELFEASLHMGVEVLKALDWPAFQAVQAAHKFREHNIKMLIDLHPNRKNEKEMISQSNQARMSLEKMFEEEKTLLESRDSGW